MAKIMTVRPPEKLHNLLKQSAKNRGLTLNALILQILWEFLEKEQTDRP